MNPFHVTGSELADILGVTPTRVTQMAREGLPRAPGGGFDLRAAASWYCERLRRQTESARGELATGRARLATARADREELELAERRGELVSAAEVRDHNFTATRLCRDHLLGIPDRLSAVVAGQSNEQEVHRLMTEEIRESLTQLSAKLRAVADGIEGKSMSDASADPYASV